MTTRARQLELLARLRGDVQELFNDHEQLHECVIFRGLCEHVRDLAEACGFRWDEIEDAYERQQNADPMVYHDASDPIAI